VIKPTRWDRLERTRAASRHPASPNPRPTSGKDVNVYHQPATLNDVWRSQAINLQVEAVIEVAYGLVRKAPDGHGKEKVYGSIP
jgi:hypothetical protein